jgi:hypothetical protein
MTQAKLNDGAGNWTPVVIGSTGATAIRSAALSAPMYKQDDDPASPLQLQSTQLALAESQVQGLPTSLSELLTIDGFAATRQTFKTLNETVSKTEAIGSSIVASGTVYLTFFTATATKTASTMWANTSSTSISTSITFAKMGIYDCSTQTLIGNTTDDYDVNDPYAANSLFSMSNTKYIRNLYDPSYQTQGVALTAGKLYAAAVLITYTSNTIRLLSSKTQIYQNRDIISLTPMLSAVITGQTNLPTSYTVADFNSSSSLATPPLYFGF